jgi:hypothetical protein
VSARACLPDPDDEDVIIDQVRRRRIALTTMREHHVRGTGSSVRVRASAP